MVLSFDMAILLAENTARPAGKIDGDRGDEGD
jgi:hypothetical protein